MTTPQQLPTTHACGWAICQLDYQPTTRPMLELWQCNYSPLRNMTVRTPSHLRVELEARPLAMASAPEWKILFCQRERPCSTWLLHSADPSCSAPMSLMEL